MVKSKTKIDKQASRKTNPILAETIRLAKKNDEWLEVASLLARPRRIRGKINLDRLNDAVKEGKKIVVPGKVLGQGQVDKKIDVIAFKFSKQAKKKLEESGCGVSTIKEEIKNNPQGKDIKVLK